jgi:hypothetical protein
MLIPFEQLRQTCYNRLKMLEVQGYEINGRYEELQTIPDSYDQLLAFARSIVHLTLRPDFLYQEPDDLATIQALRPHIRRDVVDGVLSEVEIKDKIFGGVYGRMLGCILGKPLEMAWDLPTIRRYLEGANAWPLSDFVPPYSSSQVEPVRRDCIESTRGFVNFVQPDDDLNYMILGLRVLEEYGPNFRTQDMALLWRDNIPYGWNWGPEHTRYCLLTGLWWEHHNKLPEGREWDDFVALLNDGEEKIGAMIRGDAFGLTSPGLPAVAAEFAWRDGRLTHAKTGLYAEMWVAAALAAAFYLNDPVKVVRAGLEQLPQKSRYVECMQEVLDWSVEEADWYKVWERINEKWGYLGFNGTFNESATIVNSLVHGVDRTSGKLDFEKVICTQVMQGWDCDSAGATAGCLAGVMAGYHNIPGKWLDAIQDTFYSTVAGEREQRISGFAQRMYYMSRTVRAATKLI